MKRALLALLALFGIAAVALVLALVAALQSEPTVALGEELRHQDVAQVVALLRSHDPRRALPGVPRTVVFQARDLEVLFSQGAQRWVRAVASVQVQRAAARIEFSVHLPRNPFGRWLNAELRWQETPGLPALQSLRLGRLPLPAGLAGPALQLAASRWGLAPELALAADLVQQVRFLPQQVSVRYLWRDDSRDRVVAALLPEAERQRLQAYQTLLAELTRQAQPAWELPLPRLLGPMFALAQARSSAQGADAVAENRAALTLLTLYANGRRLDALMLAARQWPQPRQMRVTLAGRHDFTLHFLVSAALAAQITTPLSQAIGLYKEVKDARGGSGFSFADMAANRAGTKFGELLVEEPLRLQAELARGVSDQDLVPPFADLSESLPEAELERRYGGVGGARYNAVLAEIDRRIAGLVLLR